MLTTMDPEPWGALAAPRIPRAHCSPAPQTSLLALHSSPAAPPPRPVPVCSPSTPRFPQKHVPGFSPTIRLPTMGIMTKSRISLCLPISCNFPVLAVAPEKERQRSHVPGALGLRGGRQAGRRGGLGPRDRLRSSSPRSNACKYRRDREPPGCCCEGKTLPPLSFQPLL